MAAVTKNRNFFSCQFPLYVQHDKTTASRQGLSTEIAHCPANYRQQFHIELVEKKIETFEDDNTHANNDTPIP
jgi:hypothetical protein